MKSALKSAKELMSAPGADSAATEPELKGEAYFRHLADIQERLMSFGDTQEDLDWLDAKFNEVMAKRAAERGEAPPPAETK